MINVVHGVGNRGIDSIDRLIPCLRNTLKHNVRNVDYPPVHPIELALTPRKIALARQKRNAGVVFDMTKDGEDGIFHSNGCLVGHRTMEMGRRFRVVIYLSPSMNADFHFPQDAAEFVWIVFAPKDKALAIAKLLPWNDAGSMGRIGFRGCPHPRLAESQADKGGFAHNHYFKPPFLDKWARFIDKRIRNPEHYMETERKKYMVRGEEK